MVQTRKFLRTRTYPLHFLKEVEVVIGNNTKEGEPDSFSILIPFKDGTPNAWHVVHLYLSDIKKLIEEHERRLKDESNI